MRWLLGGLAVVGLLFAGEIGHYVIATDLGALDRMEASANQDPACRPLKSPYDFRCPFPGYNSVEMTCMPRGCGDRNLNLPPTTDAIRSANATAVQADRLASLTVEAPYSAGNPDWRASAAALKAGRDTFGQPVDVVGRPKNLEEAARVVQQRSLQLDHDAAESWISTHAR